jgi:hypothetical protein
LALPEKYHGRRRPQIAGILGTTAGVADRKPAPQEPGASYRQSFKSYQFTLSQSNQLFTAQVTRGDICMRKSIVIAIALFGLVSARQALATTIVANLAITGANTWSLTLDNTTDPVADNGGIASYGIVLKNVLTVDHNSPRDGFGQGPGGSGAAGFTTLRSADDVTTLLASQDTTTPTPNLIYNFGREASSFAAKGIADFTGGSQLESPTWAAKLQVATGTFTPGTTPSVDLAAADTFSNVFTGATGATTKAATVVGVPEPAALAMAGMSLIGLLSYRRRNAA